MREVFENVPRSSTVDLAEAVWAAAVVGGAQRRDASAQAHSADIATTWLRGPPGPSRIKMEFVSGARTHVVLSALAEQLEALGAQLELVVIGGSGLLALGIISRPTRTSTYSRFAAARSRSRTHFRPHSSRRVTASRRTSASPRTA